MSTFSKLTSLIKKHEHHLASTMIIGGFVVDTLTLSQIDLLFENVVIIIYLILAGVGIILFNKQQLHVGKFIKVERYKPYLHLLVQFAFGGLFSAFFIFYSKGGTLISSWPYLVILLGLFIANEVYKRRYTQLTFQISILFITLFSYLILLLPLLTSTISTFMFLMSSVISLVIIFGFILLIKAVAPFKFKEARKRIVISVLSIFAAMQILYFLNVIPPLPLAIKDIGVFHNVTRSGSSYRLTQESVPAYKRFIRGNEYHAVAGEPVYVWSSVYAPTKLTTNIIHEWQYYDRAQNKWRTASTVTFAISGGRDGGYRGYSFKQNTFPGRWRVNVLTPHERTIGQINFTIIETEEEVELEEIKK